MFNITKYEQELVKKGQEFPGISSKNFSELMSHKKSPELSVCISVSRANAEWQLPNFDTECWRETKTAARGSVCQSTPNPGGISKPRNHTHDMQHACINHKNARELVLV